MNGVASQVVELTEANFNEVLGQSRRIPVMVDFWADWCAPCKQMMPVIEKLAREWQGRVLVAKVNADAEPLLAQQFGVRGLPTLKLVFQGQLAGELVGAQTEAALRQWLAPFLGEAGDAAGDDAPGFHAQVQALIEDGHLEDAQAALRAQLDNDKDDHRAREMLVDLLVQADCLGEAETVLAAAPAGAPLQRARAMLAFARRVAALPAVDGDAGPAASDYRDAMACLTGNRFEEGLDLLLRVMRSDRQYGDDAARRTLLEVFDLLGREDPLTVQYRRRMASLLH